MRNFRTLKFLTLPSLILVLSLAGALAKPGDPGGDVTDIKPLAPASRHSSLDRANWTTGCPPWS
jgi:hypothetical protein